MPTEKLKRVLDELRALPAETEWVEFKRASLDMHFNDIGKYFSALSNEANLKSRECGWLILGVEDKTRKITGTQYRIHRHDLDSLKNEIANKTTNRISFIEIYELKLPEGRVVMFEIPAAPQGIPIAWEGHYYGREGESLSPLNLQEIEQIRRQIPRDDWSAQVCIGATIDDLLIEKLSNALSPQQKIKKIGNMLYEMTKRDKMIKNIGSDRSPKWVLVRDSYKNDIKMQF